MFLTSLMDELCGKDRDENEIYHQQQQEYGKALLVVVMQFIHI